MNIEKKDFSNKIAIVIEEADETLFWLEMIKEINLIQQNSELKKLMKEAGELVAIFVAT